MKGLKYSEWGYTILKAYSYSLLPEIAEGKWVHYTHGLNSLVSTNKVFQCSYYYFKLLSIRSSIQFFFIVGVRDKKSETFWTQIIFFFHCAFNWKTYIITPISNIIQYCTNISWQYTKCCATWNKIYQCIEVMVDAKRG